MKLTVFNGSPRGEGSNTRVLLEHFLNGFMTTDGNSYELAYLVRVKDHDNFVNLFQEAEQLLLAFPLYADAMPAIVKTFIESLEPLCGRDNNTDIGFIVQSGFPEPVHSLYVERYLEKLARRLGCRYKGTVTRGGVEGIRTLPERMNRKLFNSFYQLGETYGKTGEFDKQIVLKLKQPEKINKRQFFVMKFFGHSLYWNPMLKKNKAFDKRFARPYVD
jgi:NAD(P)H-dependent FMN reductase